MGEAETPPHFYPLYWAQLDAAGRLTAADGHWQQVTATAPGEDWLSAFSSEDHHSLEHAAAQALASGRALLSSARLAREPAISSLLVLVPQDGALLAILRRPAPVLHRGCEPLLWRVLDSLPIGLTVSDTLGRVTESNPAARRLWQDSDAALPAQPEAYRAWWTDGPALDPADWPARRALEGAVTERQMVEIETLGGERRVVVMGAAPLRDARERISAAVTTYRDVTDLHQTQCELRRSERRLRRVLETLPVGVWFTDAEGRIVMGNAAGREIWEGARYVGPEGYGQYLGWWADSGRRVEAEDWAVHRALREGETSLNELIRIETFAGHSKYISNSAAPLRDDHGKITGAIIVNEDVTARVAAEEELALLGDIVASTGDAVISADREGRISSWNAAAAKLFGHARGQAVGEPLHELVIPAQRGELQVLVSQVLAGRNFEAVELRALHTDGREVEVSFTLSPLRDRSDHITGVCVLGRDITLRKRDEETLRLWAHALSSTRNGIAVLQAEERDWRIVFVNAAFEQLTGYPAEETLQHYASEYLTEVAERPDLEELREALAAGVAARVLLHSRRRDGSLYWNEISLGPVRDQQGRLTHYVAVLDDVTDRIHYEAELAHRAGHDGLTGLPNRNLLRDRLHQALAQAHRSDHGVALLFLDLDGFKHVNDNLGHEWGDQLLREVGQRLVQCLREEDTVARLGGDEFVLLLGDLERPQDAGRVAVEVIRTLHAPFQLGEREVYIGASIGIAAYPEDSADDDELMRHADAAMYRAKQGGKGGFRFYSPQLDQRAGDRVALETSLRRAVDREEFVLLFQPQRDMSSGKVVGVEALLRWDHPEWGLVRPDLFISVAEETGLIVPIGRWVLQRACEQMEQWRRCYGWDFSVAVNLSARQFANPDKLLASVHQALEGSGLPARHLELELTESMLMREPQQVGRTLAGLKDSGIALAIDDFGIGYSSLNYLRSFPVDKLKIDRAFIRDLGAGRRPAALTASIVALGHSLELTMIGEGVETAAQLEQLAATGCDQVQGYWCGRPLTASAMVEYIRDNGGGEGMRR